MNLKLLPLALALAGLARLAHGAQHNDMDGDGRSDLIWRNSSTGAVVYWPGASAAGVTTVRATRGYNVPNDFDSNRTVVDSSYSYYGDSRSHLVGRDSAGVYFDVGFDYNAGNGYRAYPLMAVPLDWRLVATGDFDNDGEAEFVLRNQRDGRNVISYWGWDERVLVSLATVPNLAWNIAGVGDFDGDGKADLFWRNAATGQNAIWRSGSSAMQLPATRVPNLAWTAAAVGDFNGDGRADIFWRNTSTGANAIWPSARASVQRAVTGVSDQGWQVTATGDFDGDGRADLFWRHAGTGANVIWKSADPATRQGVTGVTNQAWRTVK